MWPFSTLIRDTAAKAAADARDNGWTAFLDNVTPVASGVSVSEDNAVNLPAVYRCVSLNAETIGSMPVDVFAKRGDTRVPYTEPAWIREPNERQTMAEFIAMTQTSLDLNGNCYWLKVSDGAGRLVGLELIAPSAVEPRLVDGKVIYFIMTGDGRKPYPATAIVHLRGLTLPGSLVGLSPIACAKQTIGIGLAAEQFGGQFFGNGATLSGVIEATEKLTQETVDRLKADFTKRHGGISQSHAIGILTGGATWRPLSVNPEEAQFLETRNYTNDEVSQMFGYPAGFFSSEGVKGYVSALYAMLRLWHVTGLLPRITRIERALSSLLPRPAYVKLNTGALLRMEPDQQAAFFAAGIQGEYLFRDEIRAWLDLDPLPNGEGMKLLKSVQFHPPDAGSEDEPTEGAPEAPSS